MSSPGESAAGNASLDDDVVREILLRLPSSTVLRSRAVCKSWHRITTERSFLAAHAERQPAELLVVSGSHLDTIPMSLQVGDGDALTRRRSHLHYPERCAVGFMLGSCDGLLLFTKRYPGLCGCDLLAWNPVTRRGAWLDLAPPSCRYSIVRMCGFYRHGPSGEHRLLVLANETTGPAVHYVFSVAAASEPPRRLGPVADEVVVLEVYASITYLQLHHRGKLHWTMHPVAERAEKILSFDTVSEAFRLISLPIDRYHCQQEAICLLELDGMLAVADAETDSDPMQLWVLEDYENDRSWSLRYRIHMRPHFRARWAMGTGIPDVVLVGSYCYSFVALYHLTEKKIIKHIDFDDTAVKNQIQPGHFLFKDSLVPICMNSGKASVIQL